MQHALQPTPCLTCLCALTSNLASQQDELRSWPRWAFWRSTVPGGERSALLHADPWQVSSLFLGGNFIMVGHRWAAWFQLMGKFGQVHALPPALPQYRLQHAPADSDLPRAAGRIAVSLKLQATALGF